MIATPGGAARILPMHYVDHAATTPMRPEVWAAMEPFASQAFGNSSGSHGVSRRAKNALEEARERVAELLGARPLEIVLTAGGTEADNLAIKGVALAGGRVGGVITSPTEHEAVLESAGFLARLGGPVRMAAVDGRGRVDPGQMASLVDGRTAVVSIMAANNETGVVQPVAEVAAAVRAAGPGVAVHTDAVQAFATRRLDVDELGVDLLSLAAHKFGGPKGVGLLYVREGTGLEPVLHGGGQELGRRSGTHNVMAAVGMATAMELADKHRREVVELVGAERDAFEETLSGRLAGVGVTVGGVDRLVSHAHVRIPGIRNETLLVRLDRAGVAASAASACQSGAATVSHVLEAMGMTPDEARECLRFSFGWTTGPGEGAAVASLVAGQVEAMRS